MVINAVAFDHAVSSGTGQGKATLATIPSKSTLNSRGSAPLKNMLCSKKQCEIFCAAFPGSKQRFHRRSHLPLWYKDITGG